MAFIFPSDRDCKNCDAKGKNVHCDEFDAYYCTECNNWQEDKCGVSDCEFCANRPENYNG